MTRPIAQAMIATVVHGKLLLAQSCQHLAEDAEGEPELRTLGLLDLVRSRPLAEPHKTRPIAALESIALQKRPGLQPQWTTSELPIINAMEAQREADDKLTGRMPPPSSTVPDSLDNEA